MTEFPTPPRSVEPPLVTAPPVVERRSYLGWICLTALLLLMFLSNFSHAVADKPKKSDNLDDYLFLRIHASSEAFSKKTLGGSKSQLADIQSQQSAAFDGTISALVEKSRTDLESSRLYGAQRTEQGNDVPAASLAPLLKSDLPADHALAQVYGAKKLTLAEAQAIVRELPDKPFIYKLAQVEAMEKAGDKTARSKAFTGNLARGLIAIAFGGLAILVGSFVCWILLFNARATGQLQPLGFPLGPLSLSDSDRLATRAAQILGLFLLLSIVGEVISLETKSMAAGEIFGGIGTLLVLALLARVPVSGKVISLRKAGMSTENFAHNLGYGIAAFLIEYPICMGLAFLGMAAFSFLPAPSHPDSAMLRDADSVLKMLPILLFATITAPLWEEFVFRGMIFSALTRVTGKIVFSGILTGFIFAMVHPQGPALWLSLATVGVVGCGLTYYTRSLVPSIVMHMLHNGITMAIAVLMMLKA